MKCQYTLTPDAGKKRLKGSVMSVENTEVVENEVVESSENTGEVLLTQADVDRIVKERLAREKAKFADYEELKAASLKLAEIEEAQKTETQRANDAAAAAVAEAQGLRARIRQQAVMNAAIQGGAVNPEQVAALIDLSAIEDSEDSSALGEAVTAFLTDNPHFVKSSFTKPTVPVVTGNEFQAPIKSLNFDEIAAMDAKELAANPELLAAVITARNSA
jgi:hypothetical protein